MQSSARRMTGGSLQCPGGQRKVNAEADSGKQAPKDYACIAALYLRFINSFLELTTMIVSPSELDQMTEYLKSMFGYTLNNVNKNNNKKKKLVS